MRVLTFAYTSSISSSLAADPTTQLTDSDPDPDPDPADDFDDCDCF